MTTTTNSAAIALAATLHGLEYCGRDYGARMTEAHNAAKASGLVIVRGESDDNMDLSGAIYDQFSCYDGGTALVDAKGLLRDWDSVKDDGDQAEIAEWMERKKTARTIAAIWSRDDISWQYETTIPHATFDVMEDGDVYSRGMVFALADLSAVAAPADGECWSADGENYSHGSLGDLLDSDEDLLPGATVHRATAKRPAMANLIDVDGVIENMGERAHEFAGEHAEGYPEVTTEHKAKLQALLEGWLAECPAPTFYMVKDSATYVLTEDDFTTEDLADRRSYS